MTITLKLRKETFYLEGTHTIKETLEELDLSIESHLIIRDGTLLNDNDVLRDGEEAIIISAISGG